MQQATASLAADLELLRTSFRRHLQAANLSARTLEAYDEAISQLIRYLSDHGMPLRAMDLRREHIEAFITDLLERFKPATANNRYRGLSSFFRWLLDEGEITRNPMDRMRPPKVPEYRERVLEEHERRALFASLAKDRSFTGIRDLAILRAFLSTGARLSEITNLRYNPADPLTNDVDLDQGILRVMGKGRRERFVGLNREAIKVLDRYERARAKHPHADAPWFWLGKKGRMTADGIGHMVRERGAAAGIDLHAHALRHTWRHLADTAGMSEGSIQQLGGWRDLRTMRHYANTTATSRALADARAHPIPD